MKRLHVHVGVDDLAQSIRFYSTLFGAEPSVAKPDYAKWMLEDPRASRYLLTGTLNRPCARNGTPVLCWVSAYPPGVCVVAELATGRVVSRNQVVVDTSPTGTRLRNQLLRAVDNPDLPVFDFAGVLDLISMGEWALACVLQPGRE